MIKFKLIGAISNINEFNILSLQNFYNNNFHNMFFLYLNIYKSNHLLFQDGFVLKKLKNYMNSYFIRWKKLNLFYILMILLLIYNFLVLSLFEIKKSYYFILNIYTLLMIMYILNMFNKLNMSQHPIFGNCNFSYEELNII